MDLTGIRLPGPLLRLHRYWLGKLNGRLMPSRADIDPAEMRGFLKHTILLDVLEGPRFRVRLAGTQAVEAFGEEVTGRFLDELDFGDQHDAILDSCAYSVMFHAPKYYQGVFTRSTDAVKIKFERLGLPLSADGVNVNILLIGSVSQRLL